MMLFFYSTVLFYYFNNVNALVHSMGVVNTNHQIMHIWRYTSLYYSNIDNIDTMRTNFQSRTKYYAQTSLSSSPSALSLNELSTKAFDIISSVKSMSKWQKLSSWESILDELTQEIKSIKDPKALLSFYEYILQKVAPTLLDPLQISTFEVISNAVIDTLISLFPRNTPITALIDEITDLHLEFIERFRSYIDAPSDVDDGYASSCQFNGN